jgi:hypothetical protein
MSMQNNLTEILVNFTSLGNENLAGLYKAEKT